MYFHQNNNSNSAAAYTAGNCNDSNGVQNGYLRIELYRRSFCSWTPLTLASLASYNSLPQEFESSLDEWPVFWSEICALTKKCLDANRLSIAFFCVSLLDVVVLISAPGDFFINFHRVLLVTFLLSVVHACISLGAMARRDELVQLYANDRYAQQGFYLEYRIAYECSGCFHYLYLYLPTTAICDPSSCALEPINVDGMKTADSLRLL